MIYNVRINVQLTSLEKIEANSEDEAIKIARKNFYNGDIMPLVDDEYFDGVNDIYIEENQN